MPVPEYTDFMPPWLDRYAWDERNAVPWWVIPEEERAGIERPWPRSAVRPESFERPYGATEQMGPSGDAPEDPFAPLMPHFRYPYPPETLREGQSMPRRERMNPPWDRSYPPWFNPMFPNAK